MVMSPQSTNIGIVRQSSREDAIKEQPVKEYSWSLTDCVSGSEQDYFVFNMLTFSGIGTLLGLGFVKLKGLGSETDDMIGLCY